MPILSLNESSRTIKKILPIVQIQHRKMTLGLFVITRRQIDHKTPLIAQKLRAEIVVSEEFSFSHGAIVTRRSLASTLCPGAASNFVTRPEIGA